MSLGDAIAVCLRKYATFSGRARRSEFWWFYLAVQLVLIPLVFIGFTIMASAFGPVIEQVDADGNLPDGATADVSWLAFYAGLGIMMIATLAVMLPVFAAMTRRLHDAGLSGWWVLLSFIGLGLVPFVMCILPSQQYENRYGPAPEALS